jgi:hypothetical protein
VLMRAAVSYFPGVFGKRNVLDLCFTPMVGKETRSYRKCKSSAERAESGWDSVDRPVSIDVTSCYINFRLTSLGRASSRNHH